MDTAVDAAVRETVFVAGTQLGKSEGGRNFLGFAIDNDPGPYLLVLPDEKSAKEAVRERILPMLRSSPNLARHLIPGHRYQALDEIELDSMSIFIAWSGSAQSLAARPCRYVDFDETDKYAAFAGDEADPISLGEERLKTYLHRARSFKRSTPTTAEGNIWKAFLACGDKRWFHVPCPHCGKFQRLIWTQCKYPKLSEPDKVKRADTIQVQRLAYYECEGCKGRSDDRHKPAMLLKGKWASERQTVTNDGTLIGERPVSPRVGFHLNSLYSPWVTFSQMAAKWILAEGDPGKTMNFRNSWLAEPDEQVQIKFQPSAVREKMPLSGSPLIVPSWAGALFATADTQKDHFYFVIRAWGYGYRSALVHFGICHTFKELYRVCLESVFKNEAGLDIRPQALLIDSGGTKSATNPEASRTDEVYEFAMTDPGRIYPTKGASANMSKPNTVSKVGTAGMQLYLLDTDYYKRMLARLIVGKIEDGKTLIEQWLPHREVSEDYCNQIAAEHQIRDRKTGKMSWQLKSQGAANHYLDCEVEQCAAAEISNVAVMRPPEPTPETAPVRDGFNPVAAHKGKW